MSLFNDDEELRDRNGHLPDTLARNIGVYVFGFVMVATFLLMAWIIFSVALHWF